MSYPLPKDPQTAYYLNMVRVQNKKMAAKCYHCNKKTIGINCDRHRIIFVCKDHLEEYPPVKVIDDMPGVVHRVYPEGLKIPENMLNPNIGSWLKPKQ